MHPFFWINRRSEQFGTWLKLQRLEAVLNSLEASFYLGVAKIKNLICYRLLQLIIHKYLLLVSVNVL